MKAYLSILEHDELLKIHEASLTILSNTGLRIYSKEACNLLHDYGAKIDKDNIVYIPEYMVEDALKNVAQDMVLGARDKKYTIHPHELSIPAFSTCGFSSIIYDYKTGKSRIPTEKDLIEYAKIADYFSEIKYFSAFDASLKKNADFSDLYTLYITLQHTAKPIQCFCSDGKTALLQSKLSKIVANKSKEPIFSSYVMPISPLTLGKGTAEAIINFAKEGIPISPYGTILANSTAPATVAGSLALSNAENLAILTLCKCANKKGEMIYSTDTCPMDFLTGAINYESPEYLLFAIANRQIADYYGLVSCVSHSANEELPSNSASLAVYKEKIISNFLVNTKLSSALGSKDSGLAASLLDMVFGAYIVEEVSALFKEEPLENDDILLSTMEKISQGNFSISVQRKEELALRQKIKEHRFENILNTKDVTMQIQEIIDDILLYHKSTPIPQNQLEAMAAFMQEAETLYLEEGDY
ncbi:MAG: trimethylamine methyltransferase family protein [Clostridiales bacterium]